MSVAGIIAEFDPFHNGHQYLIDTVRRELSPRAVVCVMSGNFTQRGEPAILNKFARAALAVQGGADLVIELPLCCAVNAAREFALGGVHALQSLGLVTQLAFGSETGDTALLQRVAKLALQEDGTFREALKEQLQQGRAYGTAYACALKTVLGAEIAEYPCFPASNDILALEYIKQLYQKDFALQPHAIKRIGSGHKDDAPSDGISSGEAIRKLLASENDPKKIESEVPAQTLEALRHRSDRREMQDRMFAILQHRILSMTPSQIAAAPGVSEGLEHVVAREIRKATDYENLLERIGSRRYPKGRVRRILTQILLGIEGRCLHDLTSEDAYVHVLAFNEAGAALIRQAKKEGRAQLFAGPGQSDLSQEQMPSNLLLDMRASEVYGILCGKSLYESSDRVNVPKMFRNESQ